MLTYSKKPPKKKCPKTYHVHRTHNHQRQSFGRPCQEEAIKPKEETKVATHMTICPTTCILPVSKTCQLSHNERHAHLVFRVIIKETQAANRRKYTSLAIEDRPIATRYHHALQCTEKDFLVLFSRHLPALEWPSSPRVEVCSVSAEMDSRRCEIICMVQLAETTTHKFKRRMPRGSAQSL